MITYLIGIVATFFVLTFFARKFNSKLELYETQEDKVAVMLTIGMISVFWLFSVPVISVIGFFAFVIKNSTKLLK